MTNVRSGSSESSYVHQTRQGISSLEKKPFSVSLCNSLLAILPITKIIEILFQLNSYQIRNLIPHRVHGTSHARIMLHESYFPTLDGILRHYKDESHTRALFCSRFIFGTLATAYRVRNVFLPFFFLDLAYLYYQIRASTNQNYVSYLLNLRKTIFLYFYGEYAYITGRLKKMFYRDKISILQ